MLKKSMQAFKSLASRLFEETPPMISPKSFYALPTNQYMALYQV